jgi:hypothetical protein
MHCCVWPVTSRQCHQCHECINATNAPDACAVPLSFADVKDIVAAYRRAGGIRGKDSARNIFGILSLWLSVGRSGETAALTWDSLQWDRTFNGVFAEIFQIKTRKKKLVVYLAGADRHCDWFLALGDYLTFTHMPIQKPDDALWLLIDLKTEANQLSQLPPWRLD